MAIITGGRVNTPRGTLSWQPARPVAAMFEFYTTHAALGYECAGVIGNSAHLNRHPAEDHTPYSQDDVTIAGKHYVPKPGWVYAIDGHVPDMAKFERWFLARLRAGFYPWVKYFNINMRHWKKSTSWNSATHSGDPHLHISVMPGSEYAAGNPLADYEVYRTTGRNVGTKVPVPAPAKPGVLDAAVRKLPPVRRGHNTQLVGLVQAALVARGLLGKDGIDHDFGADTETGVKKLQKLGKIPDTGVVDTNTWDTLYPETNPTIRRGDDGFYALLMQCLLHARGFDPGGLDGAFGGNSVAALKRFQAAKKVRNSVVHGQGDGIGGDATWVSLVTT